jgi:hypothetical protein
MLWVNHHCHRSVMLLRYGCVNHHCRRSVMLWVSQSPLSSVCYVMGLSITIVIGLLCYYVMGLSITIVVGLLCYGSVNHHCHRSVKLWVCQSPLSSVCYVIIYNYVMGQSPSVCRQNGFHAITFILTDRPFNEVGFDCRDCCHTCFQTGPKMLKWCHFFKENWEIFSRGSNPYSDDVN